jgi:hypothetical protein
MTQSPESTPGILGQVSGRKLIFVSYASQDAEAARQVVTETEAHGIPCWMAPRDVQIGSNYGGAIVDAIEAAEVFVLLLSASANGSIHVAHEVERAVNYHKLIVPLRLENVEPCREIELHLAGRQWVDLFGGPQQKEKNMRRFFDVLRDILRAWLVPDLPRLSESAPQKQSAVPPLAVSAPRAIQPARPVATAQPVRGQIQSDPALRQEILSSLSDNPGPALQTSAVTLFRSHGATILPEICLLLREKDLSDQTRCGLIIVLAFCAVQPGARGYLQIVLAALLDNLKFGSYVLANAIDATKKLPVPRNEKFAALWSSVDLVHIPSGHLILDALIEIVPTENRNDLCDTLTELVHMPNSQLQSVCVAGLKKFGYRAAISDLRDVVETCADFTVVVGAAEALVSFGDSASAASIRIALAQPVGVVYYQAWAQLAFHLRAIEGVGCAEYVAEQFLRLPEEIQLGILKHTWLFRNFRERPLSDALRTLVKSTPNPDMRQEAQSRLSALGAS